MQCNNGEAVQCAELNERQALTESERMLQARPSTNGVSSEGGDQSKVGRGTRQRDSKVGIPRSIDTRAREICSTVQIAGVHFQPRLDHVQCGPFARTVTASQQLTA